MPAVVEQLRDGIDVRLARRDALKDQIGRLQEELDRVTDWLFRQTSEAEDERIETPTHILQIVTGTTTKLDPERLLRLGVKPLIIQKATVTKPTKPYLRVNRRKED